MWTPDSDPFLVDAGVIGTLGRDILKKHEITMMAALADVCKYDEQIGRKKQSKIKRNETSCERGREHPRTGHELRLQSNWTNSSKQIDAD